MDPSLIPAFRPVAAANDGILIICNVKVAVLDRTNLFGVHVMISRFNLLLCGKTVPNRSNSLNLSDIMTMIKVIRMFSIMHIMNIMRIMASYL
jgi:hypothetical protein